jgi:hypothetical protein
VYGPVRTVVWQGSAGDCRPYADQVGIPDKWLSPKPRGVPRQRNRSYFTPGPDQYMATYRKSDFAGTM